MKRTTNKLISLFLTLLIFCLILSSCNIEFGWKPPFPDGYTGGIDISPNSGVEPYLFETYDELMSAVDTLKSHGSTFDAGCIVACEEKEFDVKHLMILNARKSDRIIKHGDDPFNRCVKDVYIQSIIFLEEVTIEELSYSFIDFYDSYSLYGFDDLDYIVTAKRYPEKIEYNFGFDQHYVFYDVSIDGKTFGHLSNHKDDYTELTEENLNMIVKSLKLIGFTD